MYTNVNSHYKGDKIYDGLTPFIVPPLLAKESFYRNRMLKIQWEKAFSELQQASDVVFIGYSLPETDLATRLMFINGLKEDVTLHVCIREDDKYNETLSRYTKLANCVRVVTFKNDSIVELNSHLGIS